MFLLQVGEDKHGDRENLNAEVENQEEGEEEESKKQVGNKMKRRIQMRMEKEHAVVVEVEAILKEDEGLRQQEEDPQLTIHKKKLQGKMQQLRKQRL